MGNNLARMFHESPAATADMTVLPRVLGCSFDRLRTGSPCGVLFKYAADPIPRYRGIARWHILLHGLATAIHETSGLAPPVPLVFNLPHLLEANLCLS